MLRKANGRKGCGVEEMEGSGKVLVGLNVGVKERVGKWTGGKEEWKGVNMWSMRGERGVSVERVRTEEAIKKCGGGDGGNICVKESVDKWIGEEDDWKEVNMWSMRGGREVEGV